MKAPTFCFTLIMALCLCANAVFAQEELGDVTLGVVRVDLSQPYASAKVDGQSWDDQYFEDDGAVMFLEGIDRTQPHSILLSPMDEEFKPEEVSLTASAWKLVRVDKETRRWEAKRNVKFRKWKKGEKEALEQAAAEESQEKPAPSGGVKAKPAVVAPAPEKPAKEEPPAAIPAIGPAGTPEEPVAAETPASAQQPAAAETSPAPVPATEPPPAEPQAPATPLEGAPEAGPAGTAPVAP